MVVHKVGATGIVSVNELFYVLVAVEDKVPKSSESYPVTPNTLPLTKRFTSGGVVWWRICHETG